MKPTAQIVTHRKLNTTPQTAAFSYPLWGNQENLKFYCNEGLVPNVKRDRRNYRVFDEHDIKWIQSLNCLKSCGMSIAEMKQYLALCMEDAGTIPERKVILAEKKKPCSNPLLNCKRQWHTLTGSRDSMTMCCQARQCIAVILFRNCLSDISVQLTQQIPICLSNPQKPLIFQGFTPVFHSNLICLPLFLPLRAETRATFYSPPTTLSSSLAEVRFASLVE